MTEQVEATFPRILTEQKTVWTEGEGRQQLTALTAPVQ